VAAVKVVDGGFARRAVSIFDPCSSQADEGQQVIMQIEVNKEGEDMHLSFDLSSTSSFTLLNSP